MLTNEPARLKPQEIYSAAMNEWLEHNGDAPMLVGSGWAAHAVGLDALVAAAKAEALAEALAEVRANLSGTIGPVKCDADETGTFLDGMLRMREHIEAELNARVSEIRAVTTQ